MATTHSFDAFGQDLLTVDYERTDRSITARKGLPRELDAASHVPLVL
jgi:hypothetical protein